MKKIECYLFGTPKIIEDGKDIYIPMGKVSGIVYYLLIKKYANRDELASIFWPSSNEERAKTSLRNALHKIRKVFSQDLILTPNNSIVVINENLDIFVDAEKFEEDPINNNRLYVGDFLKGFYVRGSVGFDDWLLEARNYYKEKFITNIENIIVDKYNINDFSNLESNIYKLIDADNFNETGYLYLMKYFDSIDRYDKVINEYHKYKTLLKDELGIAPPEQVEEIYKKATKKIKENTKYKKSQQTRYLYNREFELNMVQENSNEFKCNNPYKSILITGEYGIGKTVLINEFIKDNENEFKIFKIECHSVEKDFTYSPWLKLIREIDDELSTVNLSKPKFWDELLNNFFFDSNKNLQPYVQIFEFREKTNKNLLHNSLLNAFEILNNYKKTIVVLEDIQWIDKLSVELLNNLILHTSDNVMFIISMSEETDRNLNSNFKALIDLNKLIHIKLKLFDKREASVIIKKELNSEIPKKDIDYIYNMSKGNAFFLKEYIDLYKNNKSEDFLLEKINNIFYEKFDGLTELEQNILNMLSVYYGEMSIDFLTKTLNVKAFEILKSINNLVRRKIIDEKKINGQTYIEFSYNAYQEYIYKRLNNTSKQILHREVAKVIENALLNDNANITSYIKLKYHYSKSNEPVKTLKYKVYILNYYLNFNHELYPELNYCAVNDDLDYLLNNEKALDWINNIESEIIIVKNTCKTKNNIDEISEIELLFLYCKGRYLIRCGNYNEGTKVMRKVINYAKNLGNESIELYGHKQMIIYGIQINDTDIMINHIVPGIRVAKKINSNQEQGVLYRLYGLYYMMKGDFKSAENLLNKSLDRFNSAESVELKNPVSIAAVYNYLGEIKNAKLEYDEALEFYNMAIDQCKGIEATCLAIFYINAGKISFLTKNYDDMKKYLLLAKKIVKQFDSYWKTPVLEALISLMLFIEREYDESMQYLQLARTESKIINNPRDKGMIDFVATILSSEINKKHRPEYSELKKYISKKPEVYYYNSTQHLDPDKDRAEIEYLKKIILKEEIN